MKIKRLLFPIAMLLFMGGCVVFSFYPIYTPEDLFPNDLVLGQYVSADDSASWNFTFKTKKVDGKEVVDSLGYKLKIDETNVKVLNSEFEVHLIKINDKLIADFYLTDYSMNNHSPDIGMFDLHIISVHTFAKLDIYDGDSIKFHWFDPGWLEENIKNNKIRIHHEKNDETILLTAKPKELQKFIKKYLDTEKAFKDGLEMMLYKTTND